VWQEVKLTDINAGVTLFQFRLTLGTADLRSSLESQGQLEPIDLIGEDKPFRIVDGFRRFHAAKELGWTSIHAFVHREMGERDAIRLAFAKNVVRRNLSPLEKANAMHVATSRGMTLPDLAGAFGLSERQVRRYLQILELPEAVQDVLDGRVVTMAHGRLLADYRVKDPGGWAKRILDAQLDVGSLKRQLREEFGSRSGGRKPRYVLPTKTGVRIYGCTIQSTAPKTEREVVIKALREAIRILEK
jgi:ParB/RepB/Spo0J family partition protein